MISYISASFLLQQCGNKLSSKFTSCVSRLQYKYRNNIHSPRDSQSPFWWILRDYCPQADNCISTPSVHIDYSLLPLRKLLSFFFYWHNSLRFIIGNSVRLLYRIAVLQWSTRTIPYSFPLIVYNECISRCHSVTIKIIMSSIGPPPYLYLIFWVPVYCIVICFYLFFFLSYLQTNMYTLDVIIAVFNNRGCRKVLRVSVVVTYLSLVLILESVCLIRLTKSRLGCNWRLISLRSVLIYLYRTFCSMLIGFVFDGRFLGERVYILICFCNAYSVDLKSNDVHVRGCLAVANFMKSV